MGKYGTAALRARELSLKDAQPVEEAWRQAAAETFPNSLESRRKGCPRCAFRGLCAAGLVRGVPADPADAVLEETANASYAITAAHLLATEPALAKGRKAKLWSRVMEELGLNSSKRHNSQLDVVLALWNAGHISIPATR